MIDKLKLALPIAIDLATKINALLPMFDRAPIVNSESPMRDTVDYIKRASKATEPVLDEFVSYADKFRKNISSTSHTKKNRDICDLLDSIEKELDEQDTEIK